MAPGEGFVRLDRWLVAARVFKSRPLAAAACAGGKVKLNGESAKPARAVRPGDRVEATVGAGRRRVLAVIELAERRGPAAAARELYEDLTPPDPPRTLAPVAGWRVPGAGRPTKRERRALDRLRVP